MNYPIVDVNNEIFLKEFRNILFWKRYFDRAEKEYNEIALISDEEEEDESLSYEAYIELEEKKQEDWELKSGYKTFEDKYVSFVLTTDYKLLLDVESPLICLQFRDFSPMVIATNDEAHFMPNLFRWEELERICNCIAKNYSNLCHPGIPMLLFWYYAPITKDDDLEKIKKMLKESWKQTNITDSKFLEEFFELVEHLADCYNEAFWEKEDDGWICKDNEEPLYSPIYSLRKKDCENFPTKDFNNLMNQLSELN